MKTTALSFSAGFLGFMSAVHAASFEVDPQRSRIQVDAKATGHAFTGDLKKYSLKAAADVATNKPTSLALSWDFNDLKTGDEKRDKEMIKWLGGGKPRGSFSFDKSWEESAAGGKAQGTLTINGVPKNVSFSYTMGRDGEWVTVDGKATLDTTTFNLPIIRTMAVMTVEPKLVVRFHIVGKVQ